MAERKQYDWEEIERAYRAGSPSIRQIAREHGCTDGAIRKRAKREGWERDLTEKVREKVRNELARDEVRGKTGDDRATEQEIIEQAGKKGANVVRKHRSNVGNALEGVEALTVALESAIDTQRSLDTALDVEKNEENGEGGPDIGKYLSNLSKCASIAVQLSAAMKNYIHMERQAYNLDEKDGTEDVPTMIMHDPKHPEKHG